MLDETFVGEWKYLRRIVNDISERQATKAMLELALFLRILDDDEGYSKREWRSHSCGIIYLLDGTTKELPPRDVANKIIHAKAFSWAEESRTDLHRGPLFVCEGRDPLRWKSAEIEIIALSAICARLVS